MTIQCCVCKKVKKGEQWVTVPHPMRVAPHASHGYCPTCAAVAFAEIEQVANARKRLLYFSAH